MPIHSLEIRKQMPRVGKIRLGLTKKSAKGSDYPITVPYFVLTDVPEVVQEYGESPTALDIIFPHRSRDIVLPTWFRYYKGGHVNKDGERIGGECACKGTGLREDGSPGMAEHYDVRDPETGSFSIRPCLEKNCPDYYDRRGNQQCKAGMKVNAIVIKKDIDVIIPGGIFQIDTTSWESMMNFISIFDWTLARPEYYEYFTGVPFTIYREETIKRITDASGKQTRSTQYIMKLKVNEERFERMKRMGFYTKKKIDLVLSREEVEMLDTAPMEDHYLLPQESAAQRTLETEIQTDQQRIDYAIELLKDSDFIQKIEDLEKVTGKKLTDKQKLIAIRQKEGAPDLKLAVMESIHASILKALEAKGQVETEATPPRDSEGII